MKKAYIKDIEIYLPSKVLTNAELVCSNPTWQANSVFQKVGIESRHVVSGGESSYTIAYEACKKLLDREPIYKEKIDYILYTTLNHEHFMLLSATLLHKELGIQQHCAALDFRLPCTGYLQLLSIAKSLIESNAGHTILVVTADTYTTKISNQDIGTRSIFGDAASATIVSDNGFAQINNISQGTNGEGSLLHIQRTQCVPKYRSNYDYEMSVHDTQHFYMIGSEIFNFVTEYIPIEYKNFLHMNHLTENDIQYNIFHQANKYMLTYLRKRLDIPEDKFYIDMADVGNTSTSSLPISLYRIKNRKHNENILLCSFGGGYTWAFCLINLY